jgi:rhodanese-related sulfurtransferase
MNGLIPSLQPLPDSRRLIALERGINLRDFGGYPTETGRYVREAMLYRSGTMAYTHEEDRQALRELGLAAIVDLRRDSERSLEPADWHDGLDVDYWRRDYKESSGTLKTGSSMFDASSAEAIAAMTDVYRAIPYDHAPSFAELFRKLAAGRVPLLVHCAAGKDRTGVAAALVLEGAAGAEEAGGGGLSHHQPPYRLRQAVCYAPEIGTLRPRHEEAEQTAVRCRHPLYQGDVRADRAPPWQRRQISCGRP